MGSPMVANAGAVISGLLALLWMFTVCNSWTWIFATTPMVEFHVSCLTAESRQSPVTGVITWVAGAVSKDFERTMNKYMKQSLWLEDAMDKYCMGLEQMAGWCEGWRAVTYGGWVMVFCGVTCACLLACGGGSMWYYANSHATATGRKVCKGCFIAAPIMAFLGVLQYTFATQGFMESKQLMLNGKSTYGVGYIFGWVLFIFTWAPLYTLLLFMKADPLEKKHWTDEEKEELYSDQQQPGYGGTEAMYANPPPNAQPYTMGPPVSSMGPPVSSMGSPGPNADFGIDGGRMPPSAPPYGGAPPPQPVQGQAQWGSPGFGASAW